jgi:molecular chaperone HscB
LRGAAVNAENNTAMPASFLMQQIAWREALDDAASTTDFDALEQQIQDSRRTALQACATLLDEQADAAGAVQQVRALMFIERFSADLQVRQDRFEAAQRGQ